MCDQPNEIDIYQEEICHSNTNDEISLNTLRKQIIDSNIVNLEMPNIFLDRAIIDTCLFKSCKTIEHIILPNHITEIGDFAFYNCAHLLTIFIPASVISIGKSIFGKCPNIKSINVDPNNPNFTVIDGNLFTKNRQNLICYVQYHKSEKFIIPSYVKSISSHAFSHCNDLSEIHISSSVESIHEFAFYKCLHLTSITVDFNNSFYTSKDGILYSKDMKVLIHFPPNLHIFGYEIPSTVECLNSKSISHCSQLAFLSIPSSVINISKEAIYKCSRCESIHVDSNNAIYTSVNGILYSKDMTQLIFYPPFHPNFVYFIPNTVITICSSAIFELNNLIHLGISENVNKANKFIISKCNKLQKFYVHPNNHLFHSYDGILFSKDMKTIIRYPSARKQMNTIFKMPSCVKMISDYAFAGCY